MSVNFFYIVSVIVFLILEIPLWASDNFDWIQSPCGELLNVVEANKKAQTRAPL